VLRATDPEGNEFCVIEPGNSFLADCGYLGAAGCDGSREVGYFWSEALGGPLVWDQDQETAIRSPLGGPKITWGGPARDAEDRAGSAAFRPRSTRTVDGHDRALLEELQTSPAAFVPTDPARGGEHDA